MRNIIRETAAFGYRLSPLSAIGVRLSAAEPSAQPTEPTTADGCELKCRR
jgi:hypothetical protein